MQPPTPPFSFGWPHFSHFLLITKYDTSPFSLYTRGSWIEPTICQDSAFLFPQSYGVKHWLLYKINTFDCVMDSLKNIGALVNELLDPQPLVPRFGIKLNLDKRILQYHQKDGLHLHWYKRYINLIFLNESDILPFSNVNISHNL